MNKLAQGFNTAIKDFKSDSRSREYKALNHCALQKCLANILDTSYVDQLAG